MDTSRINASTRAQQDSSLFVKKTQSSMANECWIKYVLSVAAVGIFIAVALVFLLR